jgi:hypothetical protein
VFRFAFFYNENEKPAKAFSQRLITLWVRSAFGRKVKNENGNAEKAGALAKTVNYAPGFVDQRRKSDCGIVINALT